MGENYLLNRAAAYTTRRRGGGNYIDADIAANQFSWEAAEAAAKKALAKRTEVTEWPSNITPVSQFCQVPNREEQSF